MEKNDAPGLELNRRTLLVQGGRGLAGAFLATAAAEAQTVAASPGVPPAPVDRGITQGQKVEFPPEYAITELPSGGPPNADPVDRRVGFAVIGLGRLSLEQILPAFGSAKHARPVALVSGDPAKASIVAAQYGIGKTCTYDRLEDLQNDPEVQAVYIVLPNAMHREYTERCARIGKHVLCEKPMTVSVADGQAMIDACERTRVQLMIAYRIQYEPNNRFLLDMARSGKLGTLRAIQSINTQNMAAPSQWRLDKKEAGGGSLPDIGLYNLNTVRALLGEEPVEVMATIHNPPNDPRFREVEDLVQFTLRFPSGVVATCTSSYSAHTIRQLEVMGSDAWARMDHAYDYHGQKLTVQRREGIATAGSEYTLNQANQFALELDHFAECVRTGRRPRTGGPEGLQDQKLMAAIYEAAATGKPVQLPPVSGLDTTRGPALPPLSV